FECVTNLRTGIIQLRQIRFAAGGSAYRDHDDIGAADLAVFLADLKSTCSPDVLDQFLESRLDKRHLALPKPLHPLCINIDAQYAKPLFGVAGCRNRTDGPKPNHTYIVCFAHILST